MELTKDSKKLIAVIYKDYLDKCDRGLPKSTAKSFGGSQYVHENLLPEWTFEDVDDTCRELHRAELIKCFWADGIAYNGFITDKGIIYMENLLHDKAMSVVDLISKFL